MEESLESETPAVYSKTSTTVVSSTLKMKIDKMITHIKRDEYLFIDVRRGFILADAMRQARKKKFEPHKYLKVIYSH